jgi:hypothetical protein
LPPLLIAIALQWFSNCIYFGRFVKLRPGCGRAHFTPGFVIVPGRERPSAIAFNYSLDAGFSGE